MQKRPSIATLRPLTRVITDRFPLELFRIVIECAQQDRGTLAACSLVCRAWLPISREHFHPRITVHPGNAARFIDIMSSPLMTLQTSIRHLVIQKQQAVVDHFFLLHSPANTPVSAKPNQPPKPHPSFEVSHILAKAASLPYITKLTLQKGYGESSAMAHHLREFLYLEELEIRSFEFTSFADLAAVISAQQNVRRLALTDVAWGAKSFTPAHGTALPTHQATQTCALPNLRRLELFMERQGELFNWILGKPSIPPVEYVELGGITEVDDAIAVSRFLRGLGPVLKHLRLYSPSRISQVNLVHNTGLQSLKISHLHIGQHDRKEGERATSAGDEVCTILSQLCSPHITAISLQLLFNEPECFAFIDWGQVARTLALPRYQNLQLMELRIPRLKRWMATTIMRTLPSIASRGILSVANG
ncbi:hypothetical protein DFP72DRAFT_972728 [Ephemerocybe angulata]|uniref:F-box domain-containing protein n=1 Tax=Ephemerocybe angulata TaxID=980116 RepID=A0A8H6LY48_9AGAR|nr:hypothetical protein DFP72DRAFT_972728 [Tulosesus angulatus]